MNKIEIINKISRLEEEKIELINERASEVEWLDIFLSISLFNIFITSINVSYYLIPFINSF